MTHQMVEGSKEVYQTPELKPLGGLIELTLSNPAAGADGGTGFNQMGAATS